MVAVPRFVKRIGASFWLLALGVAVFGHALARSLDHDEEQFVAAGALWLRHGYLPYRDFAFFHMPNLPLIFAGLFATNHQLLLTARCFNALCAAGLLVLIFLTARRQFREDFLRPAAFALTLFLNGLFQYTAGRAWNHDLAVFATVAAFILMARAFEANRSTPWLIASGSLVGIAIGTRLSFAPVAAGFVLALLFAPTGRMARAKTITVFLLGLVVALAPTLVLALVAPAQFYFDNFTYNGPLNLLYRQRALGQKAGVLYKILFLLQQCLKSPTTIILLPGAGYLFFRAWRTGSYRADRRFALVSLALIFPFIVVGVIAPTPPYRQYLFVLVPFLLLAAIYGLAEEKISRKWSVILIAGMTGLGMFESRNELFTAWRNAAGAIHERGTNLRGWVDHGPVMTLDPIYPLEGGLTIYNEFANGPFTWRTAPFLDEDRRLQFGFVGWQDLESFLQPRPPSAILTGFTRNAGDEQLAQFAAGHGYTPTKVGHDATVWLPPSGRDGSP
jgi:4-amino-4-deoxy-L-arabinose transferase-like glycosyltransferase